MLPRNASVHCVLLHALDALRASIAKNHRWSTRFVRKGWVLRLRRLLRGFAVELEPTVQVGAAYL